MSENVLTNQLTEQARDRPAIGLVTPDKSDAVAGTILRAHRRGYEVFVLVNDRETETANFAQELGATVLTTESHLTNDEGRAHIRRAVREQGFPGLIVHENSEERINYKRSVRAVNESDKFAVATKIESSVAAEPEVLVAIPAYNEAGTIADVVNSVHSHADKVVVVDDGSEDDTASKASEAGATVIQHDCNKGYGAALKTAFHEADRSGTEHLVILDGDGQHDPSDISKLIGNQRESNAEIVVGCRFGKDAKTDLPLYRRLGLSFVNLLTNLSLGMVHSTSRLRDTQNGFRCYSRKAIESLASDETIGDHMGASTDILHHAYNRNYDIKEVETTVSYDVEEANTQNPLQHGLTLVSNLLQTIEREHPVLILGVPGFVLASLGIGFGYWAFATYLSNNAFPVGLAVTSVFFTLIGVFAAHTAIILHALNRHLGDLRATHR